MTSKPSQLALLSDHIKLSLLERQRAQSLRLNTDEQEAEISRSLSSYQHGLRALEGHSSAEDIDEFRQQYKDLMNQFDGTSPLAASLEGRLNNSSLNAAFAGIGTSQPKPTSKFVRFTDNDDTSADEHARSALFNRPYRDQSTDQSLSYSDDPSDPPDHSQLNNQQLHAYHTRVLAEQDQQLDAISGSVRRIGDLSIHIGSELDEQNTMLDDLDGAVTHHQGTIDRARDRVGRIARKAKDNWSITTITILVLILVILLVVLK